MTGFFALPYDIQVMDTNPSPPAEPLPLDQPFPLKRLFLRRFVPAFIGFIGVFLLLIGFTAKHVAESIYLELAQRRAQTIARAVAGKAPAAWAHLMAGRTLAELKGDAKALRAAFNDEIREMNLPELKVYDLERKVIFATHTKEIGTTENGAALPAAGNRLTAVRTGLAFRVRHLLPHPQTGKTGRRNLHHDDEGGHRSDPGMARRPLSGMARADRFRDRREKLSAVDVT
ncbi:MAG: hypothetical protein RIB59_10070 [Rhodospirillales bacterium]